MRKALLGYFQGMIMPWSRMFFGGTVACLILLQVIYFLWGNMPKDYSKRLTDLLQTPKGNIPTIFVVTPTYSRLMQIVDMTRVKQALDSVDNLCWIVIEDSEQKTKRITNFLANSRMNYVHLNIRSPSTRVLYKGINQRNLAMKWIRDNTDPIVDGVVYFADDDNTYRTEVFDLIRYTKHVSVWPVGLVAGALAERPECKDGKVIGWFTSWRPQRHFAIDMAGFAINKNILYHNTKAKFDFYGVDGPESQFLRKITKLDQLETPVGCDRVLVWHTKTVIAAIDSTDFKKWQENDSFEV